LIIYKDGSGWSDSDASEVAHFAVSEATAERVRKGEKWRISKTGNAVEFLSVLEIEAENLAGVKATAEGEIDGQARQVRLCYVSPGKDATYQEKAAEVRAWVQAGRPEQGAGGYPYMEAEATARAVELPIVGAEIEQARALWGMLDPQIEAISRAGKVAAQTAETAEAAQNAVDQALTRLEALKP